MKRGHPTKKVTLVPAYRVDIDIKLAELIPLLWDVGIQTAECCQEEEAGFASITFPDLDAALDFLNLAGREYRVKVETGDEGEGGEPHNVGRLLVLFPVKDIPALVKRARTRRGKSA